MDICFHGGIRNYLTTSPLSLINYLSNGTATTLDMVKRKEAVMVIMNIKTLRALKYVSGVKTDKNIRQIEISQSCNIMKICQYIPLHTPIFTMYYVEHGA